MRARTCLPLLLFVLAPIPAWAGLIEVTSGNSLNGGSAARMPIAGSFMYEAVGSEACTPARIQNCPRFVPSQPVEVTLGNHRLTLADNVQIRTDGLIGGVTNFEVHAGGQTGLVDGTRPVESAPESFPTIPGPSSLIVSLGAIAAFALRARKRSRTSMA